MNKKKGFTLVEAIITIAVSVIVLSMIASVAYVTSKISGVQKESSRCTQEYAETKLTLENFISKYSSNEFVYFTSTDSVVDTQTGDRVTTKTITIKSNSQNTDVALIKYEKKKIHFYELNESNDLAITHSADVSNLKDINFNFSDNFKILRCEVLFEKLKNQVFLIDLGGADFGN